MKELNTDKPKCDGFRGMITLFTTFPSSDVKCFTKWILNFGYFKKGVFDNIEADAPGTTWKPQVKHGFYIFTPS